MVATNEAIYRPFGKSYKLDEDSKSLVYDIAHVLKPDTKAMSAGAVISTPTPDRVRDSMVSTGCKLTNYKKNPLVFWEHGFGGITKPIAKCETPEGDLAISLTSNAVLGVSYFTDKFLEAEQIFELIVDGFIRATSIRFDPIKASRITDGGEDYYQFDEWDLEEWSWVTVPCNPEAVNGVISKNRLAGRQIAGPILKSLQNVLPERAVIVRGWSLTPEVKTMAKEDDDKTKNDPPVETDEQKKAAKITADAAKVVKDAEDAKRAKELADNEDKPKSVDMSLLPYGQQVLHTAFKSFNDFLQGLEAAIKPVENAKVKQGLTGFLEEAKSHSALLEGVYTEAYPDESPLAYTPEQNDPNDVLKSFIAGSKNQQLVLKGLTSRLRNISKSKNLEDVERKTLETTIGQMERILANAEAVKVAPKEDTKVEEIDPAKLKKLRELMDETNKTVNDVLPFNKQSA